MVFENPYVDIASLISLTPFVIQFVKQLTKLDGLYAQIMSWLVCIAIAFVGYFFNLGVFIDLLWWETIVVGLGIGLAANGVYGTGIIAKILYLFINLKNTKKK